jgi:hypothetical protein
VTVGFGNALPDTGKRETRWLTPPAIVEALGSFDLDPCGAPNHSLASRTYLEENGEDGTKLPWNGRVWLNPPYGPEAIPFFQRITTHPGGGVALIFARTETRMFFDYVWDKASAVMFLKSRVKFLKEDLSVAQAANAPSVLIAYSDFDADALEASGLNGKFIRLKEKL